MRTIPPISERPVAGTLEDLASWVNKEAVPVLQQLRLAVSTPLGGQLEGTVDDASVIGLTESAGPTELAFGAVADGDFFKRVGATVVGATPSTGTAPVTLRGYYHKDQGGGFVMASTRVHAAGLSSHSSAGSYFDGATCASLQSIGAGQMAYAYAEPFEKAMTVDRVCTRINGTLGVSGNSRFKLGVYANTTLAAGSLAGSPFPGALLATSGNLNPGAGANHVMDAIISLAVAAGTYLWFVWTCNNEAVTDNYTVPAFQRGVLFPFLGFTMDSLSPTTIGTDQATQGVGWRHAITYTGTQALPDPFPQTAPAVLTGATSLVLPVVFFGVVPT